MDAEPPEASSAPADRQQRENLARAERYGKPRRVWVEDGHVFVEGHEGTMMSMTPEVAMEMGRLLTEAGTDSLINRVMDNVATAAGHPKTFPAS